jgi:peptidoglycan hydrolase CwlO-like protein
MSGNDFFDFGFSAVDLNELDVLQEKEKQIQKASGEAGDLQGRLDRLYQQIQPLLNNLKKDADKREYIYWPDRALKIEQFEAHLAKIYHGE